MQMDIYCRKMLESLFSRNPVRKARDADDAGLDHPSFLKVLLWCSKICKDLHAQLQASSPFDYQGSCTRAAQSAAGVLPATLYVHTCNVHTL